MLKPEIYDLTRLPDEVVAGVSCEVYKFNRLYTTRLVKTDTLICKYYIAKRFLLSNSEAFAKLQGNQDWRILDGRFKGVTMKYEVENSAGQMRIMTAVRIDSSALLGRLDVSKYPLQQYR